MGSWDVFREYQNLEELKPVESTSTITRLTTRGWKGGWDSLDLPKLNDTSSTPENKVQQLTHFQLIVTLEPDVRSCFFTGVSESSRRARHSWTTFEGLRTLYTGWRTRFQYARDLEFFLGKAVRGDFWGSRPLGAEFKICSKECCDPKNMI